MRSAIALFFPQLSEMHPSAPPRSDQYAVDMEFVALAYEKNTHHLIADLDRWPSLRLARLACEKYADRRLEFRNNSSGTWNAADSAYHYQVLRLGPAADTQDSGS